MANWTAREDGARNPLVLGTPTPFTHYECR